MPRRGRAASSTSNTRGGRPRAIENASPTAAASATSLPRLRATSELVPDQRAACDCQRHISYPSNKASENLSSARSLIAPCPWLTCLVPPSPSIGHGFLVPVWCLIARPQPQLIHRSAVYIAARCPGRTADECGCTGVDPGRETKMAAAAGLRRVGGRFRLAPDIIGSSGANAHFLGRGGVAMPRALLEDSAPAPAPALDAPATSGRGTTPPGASSAAASRITPAVLFVTVVLAVVLLVSGLLHVLRRLFLKSHHGSAGAGERQLQHLFFPAHGEDGAGSGSGSGGGGLGQAAIDALPEFAYGELSGVAGAGAASRKGKEKAVRPFDCAVCLCEFADHDRLRLLPLCGHAFHVACIDVWLRSSATCPLCRTKLSARHLIAAAAAAADAKEQKPQQDQAPDAEAASSSVVLPVRLGRFKNADADDAESSTGATSRIDRRRCYSMGSYQYVLADEHLLVPVHMRHGNAGGGAGTACGSSAGVAAARSGDEQHQGKKVFARGDSFSVSKIWQWRGSKRLPGGLCADDGLPWAPAAKDDHASANTRQHSDT